MPQISAGFNYTSTGANSLVTAGNLNQHVNNAQLQGGAIAEQTSNSTTADTDLLLIGKAGSLFKQTKLQFTNTINSDEINVNDLSVDTAQIDNLILAPVVSGVVNPVLDTRGTNFVVSGAYPQMRFGYSAYTGAPPTGSSYLDDVSFATRNFSIYNPAYSTSGRATLSVTGKVDIVNSAGVTTDAELSVDGPIYSNGELVMTGASVAAKTGQCGIFGTTILHKTQEFEIPADETWVFTFLAHWTTGQIGNTRPDGYYDVTASLEKSGYSDDVIQTWTKVFPSYGALCFINVVVPLTRDDMSGLAKRLKFVNTNGVAGYSWYSITLQKVKTVAFTTSSSIL